MASLKTNEDRIKALEEAYGAANAMDKAQIVSIAAALDRDHMYAVRDTNPPIGQAAANKAN